MSSSSSGYGYGIWLQLNHHQICTNHIAHVTLVCNISTETDIRKLYNAVKHNLPSTLPVKIHPSYAIFEDVYSENDPYPRSWGYYCEIVNNDVTNIISQIQNLMQSLSISGSISKRLHTTMEYKDWKNPYNLREPIETECKIVMADIRKFESEQWTILEDKRIQRL